MSRAPQRAVRALILAWAFAAASGLPVLGETLRYELAIADRAEAAFVIPFDVVHAGRIGVQISWNGPRVLSFRLEGPGTPPVRVVRSGPSPQRMQATVTESAVAAGREWKLSVRTLPARGAATVTVSVETPEPAPPAGQSPTVVIPPPIVPPPREPWALARAAPATATPAEQRVFDAVEAFRSIVVSATGDLHPDACSWQAAFLQYAARTRDAEPVAPDAEGRPAYPCARRFSAVVGKIDWLRTTDEPEVRAAAPRDYDERVAWKARRDSQIRPIEQDLDQIFALLRGGRCPDLAGEIWPSRLLACATSCERHFEEKSRLGDEAVAYADVARDEWPAILAAAAVLDAIAARAAPVESPLP